MASTDAAGTRDLRALVHRQRRAIAEVAARHGAHDVRLVGSVARGEHGAASDVDLLVTVERGRSLLDLAALHDELVALLGVDVSLLTAGSRIGQDPQVLADATPL
jgi:predicted nucleotidyltransferase